MRVGIRAKQVAGVGAIVGVSMLALSVFHGSVVVRLGLEETQARGEMLANAIYHRARTVVASAPDPQLALHDDAGLRSLLEASVYSPGVTYAAIVSVDGVSMVDSDPLREGSPLQAAADLAPVLAENRFRQLLSLYRSPGRTLEVRKPLLLNGSAFGSIRIGVSTYLLRRELDSALKPAALTAALALVVATFVSLLFARLLLRPIHVIRAGLSRLGRGELGVKLDLPRTDEFGEIGESFNTLSAQLAADRTGDARAESPAEYGRRIGALGRLTAGVAHEVRNPLNAMTIHLELLRQKLTGGMLPGRRGARRSNGEPVPRAPDIDGALQHAGVISSEIRRLDDVLQGFIKFMRPEDLTLRPVHLPELVTDVLATIAPEAERSKIVTRTEGLDTVPDVNGDAGMLQQALLNLALNACHAMPGGGTLRIYARPARGRRVELGIEDTGVGIKPDHLGKIFNLYFTTKERGSGIGLSMVYRAVHLHGGDIEVESTEGRGTTFRLLLPQV